MTEATAVRVADDFAAFFARHFAFVWRSLRHLGVTVEEAEDVVQEVFIVAYRRRECLDEPARGWLFAVARGLAANERRRRRRSERRLDALVAAPSVGGPIPCERLDAILALNRLLAELPEDQALALLLYDLEGLRGPEIAEALGVPVATAYSRIRLARCRLERLVVECRQGGSDGR